MTARARDHDLHISLLGQARFSMDGAAFRFSAPPKTLPLLAYLLLHRRTPTARDRAAFALWPDETEDDARANLRRHLYHLQRALPAAADGAAWFIAEADSLQWNPDAPALVDIAEFERLVEAGELERAVELYEGDLLDGVYDDWLVAHRERLRSSFLSALEHLVREHRSRRDFAAAARFASRLLEADPWREDAIRQLMAVRYEAGDRAGALQLYDRFKRALRQELDVDPMPETLALRDAVLKQLPLPDGAGAPALLEKRRSPDALPLVGRAAELDQLHSLWSRAARGHGTLVFVSGEAGIGKSRLAAELALTVESEGGRVLFGATSSPEAMPYEALSDAFRQAAPLLGAAQLDSMWLAAVSAIVPDLRARMPDLPALAPTDPDRERARLFEGLAASARALAAVRPLLIILEDLHWSGEATIAALAALARRAAQSAILIVATHRDQELGRDHPLRRLRRELMIDKNAASVAPRRLEAEAVEELLDSVAVLAPRAADLAAPVVTRSDGVPLFVTQVVRDMRDAVQAGADLDRVTDLLPARAGLAGAVRMNVAALSDGARTLAEIASVIGDGFDIDVVREVGGWSEAEIYEALEELIDRNVIRDVAGRTRFAYAFSHHLVRDAIYGEMSAQSRLLRHRRAGDVLEALSGGQASERAADLARHFDIGEQPERAADHYLAAARHALAVHADEEAIAHASRGIELAAGPRLRASLRLLRESALGRRGRRSEQQSDLDELERSAEQLDDEELRRETIARRIALARTTGDRDLEARLIDRLTQRAALDSDTGWRMRAAVDAALYAASVGRADARSLGLAALDLARRRGDAQAQVECLNLMASVETHAGTLDAAQRYLEEARGAAQASGSEALVARALWAASTTAIMRQQFELGAQLCETCVRLFRGIGDLEGEADALARLGSALARLNRYEQAQRANARAAELFAAVGKRQGLAMASVNAGVAATRLGALEDAAAEFLRAQTIFEEMRDVRGQTVSALNLAFLRLCAGDAAGARRFAEHALELARASSHAAFEAQALANLGAGERDGGELDAAIAHMQAGLAIARTLNRPSDLLTDLADLALAFLRKGDLASAQRLAREIGEAGEEVAQSALWPQYHYWVAARVCRVAGDDERASAFLRRAHGIMRSAATSIASADVRARFMELPVNREILQAYENDAWPEPAPRPGRRPRPKRVAKRAQKR